MSENRQNKNLAIPNKLSYEVIRFIYRKIKEGQYADGDKLPTNRQLACLLGMSILSVQQAMKQLEASGSVSCYRRKGTFLVDSSRMENPRIQSGLIGLFCPQIVQDFHLEMLVELEKKLTKQNKLLSVNFTHSQPEKEIRLLRTLVRQRLETLIYFASPKVARSRKLSKKVGNWIDRYIQEGTFVIFVDLCLIGYEDRLISMHNHKTGYILTRELIKKGHRRITLAGDRKELGSRERYEGYVQAMSEFGLIFSSDTILDIQTLAKNKGKTVENYVSRNSKNTGFVTANEYIAIAVKKILEKQSSHCFPATESIASPFEEKEPPFDAVAWIHVNGKNMARQVMNLLYKCDRANYCPGRKTILPKLYSKRNA